MPDDHPSSPQASFPTFNPNPESPSTLSPRKASHPQVTISPPRFTTSPAPESPPPDEHTLDNAKDGTNDGNNNNNPKKKHIQLPTFPHRPHLTDSHRSLSEALRAVRSREEQETLLEDDEIADPDGCLREDGGLFGPREVFFKDPHARLKVYFNIHRYVRLLFRLDSVAL